MGREFHDHSDDVEIASYHPGCMGGLFNVLDYHHWYSVTKKFPHRKYNKGRHARCCANPQTISMEREPVETQGLLDGEADQIHVQQQTRKTGSTNKSSGKASTKRIDGKEKQKEEEHKHGILGFSGRPQVQQTDSTHHLEPSGFGLGWMNPIILVRKRADTSHTSSTSSLPETPRKKVTRSKKHDMYGRVNADNHLEHKENSGRTSVNQKPLPKKVNNEVSYNQVKEGVDVLEILKVNKDLFLDILRDPKVGISKNFPGKQTPKALKLTKSGSFPVPNSPRTRYLRSNTLEHKQKEFWSFKKREKSLPGTQSSKSGALRTNDTEEASSSSQVSSRDALSTNENEISESLGKSTLEQDGINNFNDSLQTNASDYEISNTRRQRIRRTKSINESLDRYAQLFEHSASKKADLHHSMSLKLTTDDKVPSRGRVPKFFRRISSLSDLESFCSLLREVSRDAPSSETSIRSILDYDANKESDEQNEPQSISFPEDMDKFELVEAVLEAELQEKMMEGNNQSSTGLLVDRNREEIAKPCDFTEDIVELAMEKSSSQREQESVVPVHPTRELTQPTSDISDITSREEPPIPQGLELDHPNLPAEYGTMGISNRSLFFESDKDQDDPCYNYVRDVLELSGFIQNEYLQTWYSADQPLNPSLFKEFETLLHPELECSIEEVGSNCDHQLVFNLVNEVLLEIREKSSMYFPKSFSLMLKGNNVLQEVWTKVSRNLASQPESNQSLDDIVARDLAKDAWLNLQAESEFMALVLEDLIFDELLDEVLCS